MADVLANHSTSQNDISDRRRWMAVGVLVAGVVVGSVANVVAQYA